MKIVINGIYSIPSRLSSESNIKNSGIINDKKLTAPKIKKETIITIIL